MNGWKLLGQSDALHLLKKTARGGCGRVCQVEACNVHVTVADENVRFKAVGVDSGLPIFADESDGFVNGD